MTVPKRIHIRTYHRNNAITITNSLRDNKITINSIIGETIVMSVMTKIYRYVS